LRESHAEVEDLCQDRVTRGVGQQSGDLRVSRSLGRAETAALEWSGMRASLPATQPGERFKIGRHSHPKTRSESGGTGPSNDQTGPAEPTGIDYLRVLDNARGKHLAQQINYAALYEHDQQSEQSREQQ
jgi:hypothetical protein